jgi:hypothetical protein
MHLRISVSVAQLRSIFQEKQVSFGADFYMAQKCLATTTEACSSSAAGSGWFRLCPHRAPLQFLHTMISNPAPKERPDWQINAAYF